MNSTQVLFLSSSALFVSGCAVFSPTASPEHVVRGPLGVRTNGPIATNLMQFRPRAAETTAAGHLTFECATGYSSMFEDGTDGSSTVVFDGELMRTGLMFRAGVSSSTDVEVEVPLAYAASGFLDTFIESWHSFFGLPNGGRAKRDRDDYAMRVDKNGRRVYALERDELSLADVPVIVTQQILVESEAGIGLDLRAGIELPTGSERRGIGNGGLDWGGGALAEKSFGRFTLTTAAYFVDAATPESFTRANVATEDQVYYQGGVECRWNDWVSLVGGLRSSTPTTRDIPIKEVDSSVLDLDLGFVFDDPQTDWRFTFGFTEDLISESGPDFTVFFGWSRTF